MCGIVAVFGDISIKAEQAFKQMLIMDAVRGIDSTGVAVISRTGDVSICKEVGHPFYVLESDRFEKAMRGNQKALIGHNRAATTGRIIRKNAHPFETKNLVGVHNGTITSKFDIPGHLLYDTDSEALYNHIDEKGVAETIPLVSGAWSLVWYDTEYDEVHLLRNAERPMCYAFTKDKKTLFLASEMWMILAACARNGIEVEGINETQVDVHYTYELPASFTAFKDPTTEVVEGKKKPTATITPINSAGGCTKVTTTEIKSQSAGPALIGRTGETVLTPGNRYFVKGSQVFEHKTNNGKVMWYVLLEHSSAFMKSAPMYLYVDKKKDAEKFLEGEWWITISRAVANNNFVIRYVVDSSPSSYTLYSKEGMTEEKIKDVRCCNCNSKVELSEDWLKTTQGFLCSECASDNTILELISQVTLKGY